MAKETEAPKGFIFTIGCCLGILGGLFRAAEANLIEELIISLIYGSIAGVFLLAISIGTVGTLVVLASPLLVYFRDKGRAWDKLLMFFVSWIFTFSVGIFVGMRSPNFFLAIPLAGFATGFCYDHVVEWPENKSSKKGKTKRLQKEESQNNRHKTDNYKSEVKDHSGQASLAIVNELLNGFKNERIYVAPTIPKIKLKNALKSYGFDMSPSQILLLYDDTLFGGAREGLMIARDAVCWHNIGEDPVRISYSEIDSVNFLARNGFGFNPAIAINGKKVMIIAANNEVDVAKKLTKLLQDLQAKLC